MPTETSNAPVAAVLLPCSFAMTACQQEQAVSYAADVQPILQQHCIDCHRPGGTGHEASGFSMESHEALMQGTEYGPMVIPEDPEGSNLIVLMEGRADPSISMPHGDLAHHGHRAAADAEGRADKLHCLGQRAAEFEFQHPAGGRKRRTDQPRLGAGRRANRHTGQCFAVGPKFSRLRSVADFRLLALPILRPNDGIHSH